MATGRVSGGVEIALHKLNSQLFKIKGGLKMDVKDLKKILACLTVSGLVSLGGGSLPAVHAGSG
jgi:hypothetical protein